MIKIGQQVFWSYPIVIIRTIGHCQVLVSEPGFLQLAFLSEIWHFSVLHLRQRFLDLPKSFASSFPDFRFYTKTGVP